MIANKYSFNGIDNLQLLFIYLKLTGNINWGWVWILAPCWIVLLLAMLIGLAILAIKGKD